jgi:CrcB protein
MLWQWLGLAVAGAVGTLARYIMSGAVQRICGADFPFGTLAVNVLGCFLFGLGWGAAEHRWLITPQARLMLFTGFMGAFTTFSTYAFETQALVRQSEWILAGANAFGQLALGLALMVVGIGLGRSL